MNDLSCNSICQLLCCPPLPSKIAAKLAFMPPPPSYKLTEQIDEGKTLYSFTLASYLKESFIHFVPENMESMKATTRRGNEIAILYMPINSSSKLTFLLSHGNAVDLGLMLHFMYELGSKLNVNIMCYDYSGYGVSTGKPLEKNLYADAECALNVLRTKYSVPLNQIVLYGQSIGTVPTIHLATLHRVAAVVLHSPLMSGLRVAFPRLKRNYCCDVFSKEILCSVHFFCLDVICFVQTQLPFIPGYSLARTPKIISPTLVIHGTRDEVVNVTHGYRICSALAGHLLLDPLFIDGAGHNDCELFPQYLLRLTKLVTVELPQLLLNSNRSESAKLPTAESTKLLGKTKGDNETDLSNSDSIPVSLNSHGYFSINGNTIDAEEEKLTKSFISHPDRNVASNSKSSRMSVVKVCEEVTLDENNDSFGKTSPVSSLLSHECSEFVDDNSVSLLTNNELPKNSYYCSLKTEVTKESMLQKKTTYSKCSLPTREYPDGSVDELYSTSSNVYDLTLPPPPPPPPPPTSGDMDFFRSEVLWSLHSQKNGKTHTLPRKLTSRLLETEIDQNNPRISTKMWTLPRDFPSEKVGQISDCTFLGTMLNSNSESELTSDTYDPVLKQEIVLNIIYVLEFISYVRAPRVISPTLIIHGTEDDIIDRVHAQRLYERIPNTLEPLFIRGAGHNDCELYEEYLIRLEYLVHVEVEGASLIHLSHESNEVSENVRPSNRLSKYLNWNRKSNTKLSQISPNRLKSKAKSLKEESKNAGQSSTMHTNTLNLHPERTVSSFTPMWMRKRGIHGSYRYVGNNKNIEKRRCKRIHSLSDAPSERSETNVTPKKAEIRLEFSDSDNPTSETDKKNCKPTVSTRNTD
ncbi:unnamed protein product [Trichobilharzia regenti]|nr:unnamed protein product [Trichobilharzia regenti]